MAIDFDGVDDFITLGTNDDILTENAAMSVYFRIVIDLSTNNRRLIHRASATAGPSDGFSIAILNGASLEFEVAGATYLSVLTTGGLSTATEYNVVITWDGSTTAANVHVYINGAEPAYTTQNSGSGLYDTSGNATFIGKRSDDAATVYFDGLIRELALFSRVLTAAEISYLSNGAFRNRPLNIPNCVRYFPMDGGVPGASASGAAITDRTATANGTGDDGANNTGLTWTLDTVLTYPGRMSARGGMWGGS